MAESQYRLEVKNIWKAFPGTQALSGVSLNVKPGEVHALVGENGAGKSTLMNIIGGVMSADKGEVYLDGERTAFRNPTEALDGGIGFVHQELSMFQQLSVAHNIYVDRLPTTRLGTIDKKKLNANAAEMLKVFNLNIRPQTCLGDLAIGNQQMIEITRAVSMRVKLVIFDEPTSSLSENEVAMLMSVINQLRSGGISVVYITHRLNEVFQICDRVSVLKDGVLVDTLNCADTSIDEIVGKMVGREMSGYFPDKSGGVYEEIFRVENFKLKSRDAPISFSLHKGEILGFYGLIGAGRSELLRAVCGIDACAQGDVYLNGKKLKIRSYRDSLRYGITYLTEDRKGAGIFHNQSVVKNLYVSDICRSDGFWLHTTGEKERAEGDVRNHNIKTSSVDEHIMNLSGGNQQKVLIARSLRVEPKLIIMDEPTRGIDVNSKAEIHKKLRAMVESGIGVIVISSEMPEIIGVADRVIVMHEGRVTGEIGGGELEERTIIVYATNIQASV